MKAEETEANREFNKSRGLVRIYLTNQDTGETLCSQLVHPQDTSFLEYLHVEARNAFGDSLKWETKKSESERLDKVIELLGYFL